MLRNWASTKSPSSSCREGFLTVRLAIVVMGVSGSGKSTVGAALAEALHIDFFDGDALHAPESVARMRDGIALTDADRWPWLDRIGALLADAAGHPRGVAVACSALRRTYRDRLRAAVPALRFVFLDGSAELIASRVGGRSGHYMPSSLLDSQLATLERPAASEAGVARFDIAMPAGEIVRAAAAELRANGHHSA